MKILAHLSDLHFGRTDPKVVEALVADIHHARPDLIVVSGDLTQRAKADQFAQARAFLARLPAPALVVPGNHDLEPLYRPLARLLRPRARFQSHLPDHAGASQWEDDDIVVIGLDSTRHLRWKSGKLRSRHLDHVASTLDDDDAGKCKIAFLHHPPSTALAGHPYRRLAEHGLDLVLTGHVHKAHVEIIAAPPERSLVLVQASTACSTRLREDANGWALIRAQPAALAVELRGWSGESFHPLRQYAFIRQGRQWLARPGPDKTISAGPSRPDAGGFPVANWT